MNATKTAAIFDIDGTLVESSDFEDELYVSAVRAVLGEVPIREDWSTYRHVTDTGILRQIMEENHISEEARGEERRRGVRSKFGALVRQHFLDGGACRPIEGAVDLLQNLRNDDRYEVGIATGGWSHTARMKLEHAGFDLQHVVLASSDDSDERTAIMQKCLHALGNSFQRIVYAGDAEWDVRATRELGWHFIGVGPRLKGKCEHWVEDLSNHETFMKMLHVRLPGNVRLPTNGVAHC